MSASVLVAYATRSGSTQEVAEKMAATLRDGGYEVEIQPAKKVKTLAGYKIIILGAPLYMFAWHADAKGFLARFQRDLPALNVAVFALGPLHDDEKERQEARGQLDKELAKFPWFSPSSIGIFGGKYDPATLTFPFSLINKLPGSPLNQLGAGDVRNWDAIRAWTESIAAGLKG